mmetsp:Transcript_29852/g.63321  ORF Transcript_29852/g.63321 Transcript_29852/m.63321 type:complete len:84 (+) Transcript_29852:316-567(+)
MRMRNNHPPIRPRVLPPSLIPTPRLSPVPCSASASNVLYGLSRGVVPSRGGSGYIVHSFGDALLMALAVGRNSCEMPCPHRYH